MCSPPEAAAALAAAAGWPAPELVRVGSNAVFRSGDAIIRVAATDGSSPTAGYVLADWLGAHGVRVAQPYPGEPHVECDDGGVERSATAWQRLEPVAEVADWAGVGAMVRRLHRLDPASVPSNVAVPPCTSFPWWRFEARLAEVVGLVDDAALAGLTAAVERHGDWVGRAGEAEGWVLCHGDVHQRNVVQTSGGPVLLDWDMVCAGPPGWDHAPLIAMVRHWGVDRAVYDRYAEGYGSDRRDEPVTASLAVLRAVAATLMRVVAEGPGRDPDGEASRRLRFWRGDPDAPTWTFV